MTHRHWRNPALCAALLATACGAESSPPVDETPDAGVTRPTEYIRPEDPPPTAKLTTQQLGEAMKTGFQAALSLQNQSIFDTYKSLLQTADGPGGCPPMTINPSATRTDIFWQGDCTAQSGTSFRGFGAAVEIKDAVDEHGLITNGWYATLQGRLADAASHSLDGAGYAVSASAHPADNTYTYYSRELHGTFLVANGGASTPWTDGTRRVDLAVTAAFVPFSYGHYVAFEGGLSGLSGGVDSIAFQGVELGQLTAGSKCQQEPSGTISLRDPDGQWYDLVFDGPTRAKPDIDAALCDGCGRAYFRGQSIGEICADFSYLFDWGSSPW
jgi:hypothetical protein